LAEDRLKDALLVQLPDGAQGYTARLLLGGLLAACSSHRRAFPPHTRRRLGSSPSAADGATADELHEPEAFRSVVSGFLRGV